jgi:hypothetical protein
LAGGWRGQSSPCGDQDSHHVSGWNLNTSHCDVTEMMSRGQLWRAVHVRSLLDKIYCRILVQFLLLCFFCVSVSLLSLFFPNWPGRWESLDFCQSYFHLPSFLPPSPNSELQISVGTAGPQPRPPDISGHCRTAVAVEVRHCPRAERTSEEMPGRLPE